MQINDGKDIEDIRKQYKPEVLEKFLRKLVAKRGKMKPRDLEYMNRMPPEIKAGIARSSFAKMLLDSFAFDALLNPNDPLTASQWRAITYLSAVHKVKIPRQPRRNATQNIGAGIPHIDVTTEEEPRVDVKQ